jgi:hypothetical protein
VRRCQHCAVAVITERNRRSWGRVEGRIRGLARLHEVVFSERFQARGHGRLNVALATSRVVDWPVLSLSQQFKYAILHGHRDCTFLLGEAQPCSVQILPNAPSLPQSPPVSPSLPQSPPVSRTTRRIILKFLDSSRPRSHHVSPRGGASTVTREKVQRCCSPHDCEQYPGLRRPSINVHQLYR